MTMARYLGPFNSSTELTKKCLTAEIAQLKNPVGRICSLIIDDMPTKEKMYYSRSGNCIYDLSSCKTDTVGEKPDIANKMLCVMLCDPWIKYKVYNTCRLFLSCVVNTRNQSQNNLIFWNSLLVMGY
jgi:hypothetical protein